MMKPLYYLVDYLKKAILRTLLGPALFFLYIILRFTWETPEGTEFFTLLKTYWIWKSLYILIGFGFFSILLDWANEKGPDRLSIKIDKIWGKRKWGKFSSYFSKKYMERATRSSFFLRVDDLDELIHRLYDNANGEIFLFNPSPDLITSEEAAWKDIRKAIENNRNNISKVIFVIPNFESFTTNTEVANKLGIPSSKVELKQITNPDFVTLAQYLRMAVYHKKVGNDKQVEYFMYRPINNPYRDKFVLIHDYDTLNKLVYPGSRDQKLHGGIDELINSTLI